MIFVLPSFIMNLEWVLTSLSLGLIYLIVSPLIVLVLIDVLGLMVTLLGRNSEVVNGDARLIFNSSWN
jgi:hypothetical protein